MARSARHGSYRRPGLRSTQPLGSRNGPKARTPEMPAGEPGTKHVLERRSFRERNPGAFRQSLRTGLWLGVGVVVAALVLDWLLRR